jgi:methylase of polypeptide subunit release factors
MHARLEEGVRVLDVGCGTGAAVLSMAAAYPNSTIYGVDIDDEALQ